MPLTEGDLTAIAGLIQTAVNKAQFGGPTVQVAPRDLVWLGNGRYVSESKNKMYGKGPGGRLVELGDVPAPE